ncbi:hypothetical protein GCM10009850_022450 [Nonomuraea monospora]|uniref:Uncharacterized protein n=1 Tax=Nonomuraea monospora TaxID=568818 RepID=A0ABN3CBR1_9ACTN
MSRCGEVSAGQSDALAAAGSGWGEAGAPAPHADKTIMRDVINNRMAARYRRACAAGDLPGRLGIAHEIRAAPTPAVP